MKLNKIIMSSAVRKATLSTVGNCLVRPNVMQATFVSARNAVSQVCILFFKPQLKRE